MVLIDVNMPALDGTTLTSLLKMRNVESKFILVSALSRDELEGHRRKSGADGAFAKSESPTKLLQEIDRVLDLKVA